MAQPRSVAQAPAPAVTGHQPTGSNLLPFQRFPNLVVSSLLLVPGRVNRHEARTCGVRRCLGADISSANQARGDSEGAKGGESVGVAARLFSLYNLAVILIVATGASFYQVPSSCLILTYRRAGAKVYIGV